MKPLQALKSRIKEEEKHIQNEEKPNPLDILRERNRELAVREQRRSLLKRTGVR